MTPTMISAPPHPPTLTPDDRVADAVGGLRVMVVRAGGQVVAIDAARVREVAPRGMPTRLPGAPSIVSGVVNLRGSLVPLVDLGVLLGSEAASPTGWLLALDLGTRRCALALDALPRLCVADPQSSRAASGHPCLAAAAVVDGDTMPLLDVDALADDILLS